METLRIPQDVHTRTPALNWNFGTPQSNFFSYVERLPSRDNDETRVLTPHRYHLSHMQARKTRT